jgi:aspartyl-tRNA(Asn)/glutamyl-tRNA(Gln) amidotransferase subunit C
MALTSEHVRHIAKLARLKVSDEEVERFAVQLTSILEYVDMLREVDTKNVEPTSQVTGLHSVLRKDIVRGEPLAQPDVMLQTTALPIVERQIQTQSAH